MPNTESRPGDSDFIAVDDELGFSDIGSSIDTDITSLSSSIRNHVYENGRRYHSLSAGTYVMPNDEAEQERLDMLAHAVRMVMGGALHVATLPQNLHRALDCGTGTGIWAINFADEHPECKVIGIDLSPIQPAWVPVNCTFEVDDLEKPWLFKESFDFIHSAGLAQGIHDWKRYIKNIYDHLSPGGVAEFHETRCEPSYFTDDNSIPPNGYLRQIEEKFIIACKKIGLLLHPGPMIESCLHEAGFVDVNVVVKKLPIGPWAKDRTKKEIGRWGLAILEQGVQSYPLSLFTKQLGMTPQEAKALGDGAFKEACQREVHLYIQQWFITGKKPEV